MSNTANKLILLANRLCPIFPFTALHFEE